ncbi:MAG: hypothetical protein E5W15_31325, partial [Mesorhizobium sp.]
MSLFIADSEKNPWAHQMPSESRLTASFRWITIFLRLEKKPLCRPSGQSGSRRTRRREDIMKKFAAAILAGVAMSLTLPSVAEAKD